MIDTLLFVAGLSGTLLLSLVSAVLWLLVPVFIGMTVEQVCKKNNRAAADMAALITTGSAGVLLVFTIAALVTAFTIEAWGALLR